MEWWEDLDGPSYLEEHTDKGPNGHDDVIEQVLVKAKLEFKAGLVRKDWEMKRASNMQEWRRCIRENEDVGPCQSEESQLFVNNCLNHASTEDRVEKPLTTLAEVIGQWIKLNFAKRTHSIISVIVLCLISALMHAYRMICSSI